MKSPRFSLPGLAGRLIRTAARIGRRYSDDRRGVTAIEFGAVGIPFLMIVLGIVEMGLAFFVNRLIDNAVLESARLVRTGQAQQASFDADAFKDDICSHLPAFLCNKGKYIVDVTTYNNFAGLSDKDPLFDEDGDLKDSFNFNIGCSSSIVLVRVVYRWPMFTALLKFDSGDTGNAERLLYSTAVFRNEPFPWSCS
ncbi:TadE/TadG family type IV pilus assembly protein [uncultured Roseibium sp.]|uniref:TadE/TadG family type IV pilus assembly protein n=1 Tax=uncultured Roseibium sp. TaxID=1936171 RepID=UPI00321748AA